MEISSQWPETEGFFCEISWSVLASMFFITPTGSLDLVWRSNSTATILRKLTNKIPWRIPAWRMCFRDFLSLLVWEALGLQATSNTIHDIHLLKSCVFCCILPRSFPNYCQSEENKKGDINHQTWPSDIGNLPLSSSLSKPPKVRATFFPTWNKPHQHVLLPFRKKTHLFFTPKISNLTDRQLVVLVRADFSWFFQPRIWCWEFWASASHQLGTPVFDSLTLQWYLCFGVYKSYKFL